MKINKQRIKRENENEQKRIGRVEVVTRFLFCVQKTLFFRRTKELWPKFVFVSAKMLSVAMLSTFPLIQQTKYVNVCDCVPVCVWLLVRMSSVIVHNSNCLIMNCVCSLEFPHLPHAYVH